GGAHIPIRDLLAHGGVLDRRTVFEFERTRELHQLRHVETAALSAADREALVHQGGERDLPTLPDFADALRIRNLHIGEEDFVEPRGTTRLLDRTYFNAWRFHRQIEHGQTFVLGHIRVGACEQQAVIGELRTRRPDFRAVDRPSVAVLYRTRLQRRD